MNVGFWLTNRMICSPRLTTPPLWFSFAWHRTLAAGSRIPQSLTVARSDLRWPWQWTAAEAEEAGGPVATERAGWERGEGGRGGEINGREGGENGGACPDWEASEMSNSEILEGGRGMMEGVVEGWVGGRGKPYGSSTNVLNYKSGWERVDCQVGLQAGRRRWKRTASPSSSTWESTKTSFQYTSLSFYHFYVFIHCINSFSLCLMPFVLTQWIFYNLAFISRAGCLQMFYTNANRTAICLINCICSMFQGWKN